MKVKVNKVPKVLYHSAETMVQACQENYKNELESYNKIYEKVNITLGFCGALLVFIFECFDISHLSKMQQAESYLSVLFEFFLMALSFASFVLVFMSTIQLLRLMRGSRMLNFDSVAIRSSKIYFQLPDRASLWLIRAYTDSIVDIRNITTKKQKQYDMAVTKLVVAVVLHAIYRAFH